MTQPTSSHTEAITQTLRATRERLLALRTGDGHWAGSLSTSALSTATAVVALAAVDDQAHADLIRRGLAWLADHQNADGGWGDTVRSKSNISTTVLCWSAFSACGRDGDGPVAPARQWIARDAGGTSPDEIARAVARRYGKDRTFSAPILSLAALAGRLGPAREAWARVAALPFELAACPHQWFQWLRLPVVSYALPALIAIGQARFAQRPPANPLARLVRRWLRGPTLRVLRRAQPASGGFLEAAPLTSFVVMNLVAAGAAGHPVTVEGVRFLREGARDDGSWPIDTNLATWVTSLSVGALAAGEGLAGQLGAREQDRIRAWLLAQHYQAEHPYTHAAAGGWAWTDLSGGVPDADDTPGAMLALAALGPEAPGALPAASAAARWLVDLQNADGGIPTFCRGWGHLPFDRSSPDLTAHTLRAWAAWQGSFEPLRRRKVLGGARRALAFLRGCQRADGAWVPLWFGNQHATDDENPTYGTSRVVLALADLARRGAGRIGPMLDAAVRWLADAQGPDGGWGGAAGVPPSIEETALAVEALAEARTATGRADLDAPLASGSRWLVEHTDAGRSFPPAPIGFYFAKLWYYEELYPIIFTASALARAAAVLAGAAG